jgi:hypothetical protein
LGGGFGVFGGCAVAGGEDFAVVGFREAEVVLGAVEVADLEVDGGFNAAESLGAAQAGLQVVDGLFVVFIDLKRAQDLQGVAFQKGMVENDVALVHGFLGLDAAVDMAQFVVQLETEDRGVGFPEGFQFGQSFLGEGVFGQYFIDCRIEAGGQERRFAFFHDDYFGLFRGGGDPLDWVKKGEDGACENAGRLFKEPGTLWLERVDSWFIHIYGMTVMSLFRNPIFLAMVAVLLFCGYSAEMFGACPSDCGKVEHAEAHESGAADSHTDCQCVCHAGYVLQTVNPVLLGAELVAEASYGVPRGEFPPAGVPLGIDYPPQLA